MNTAIGKRVKIKLRDPDAGYGSKIPPTAWPDVRGEIVHVVPGFYDKLWYLVKLTEPLPAAFIRALNILEDYLKAHDQSNILYLLLSPAPAMPTREVPRDFIGASLEGKKMATVLVSIGLEPGKLPRTITAKHAPSLFPCLCSGHLQLDED